MQNFSETLLYPNEHIIPTLQGKPACYIITRMADSLTPDVILNLQVEAYQLSSNIARNKNSDAKCSILLVLHAYNTKCSIILRVA